MVCPLASLQGAPEEGRDGSAGEATVSTSAGTWLAAGKGSCISIKTVSMSSFGITGLGLAAIEGSGSGGNGSDQSTCNFILATPKSSTFTVCPPRPFGSNQMLSGFRSMDDSMAVCFRKRQADLVQKVRNQRQCGLRMGFLESRKRFSVEKFHHQVRQIGALSLRYSEVRNIDNVGMAQAAARLRFPLEPPQKVRICGPLGCDDLDRHDPGRSEMRRKVDVAHTACAKPLINPVLAVKNITDHCNRSPVAMITERLAFGSWA